MLNWTIGHTIVHRLSSRCFKCCPAQGQSDYCYEPAHGIDGQQGTLVEFSFIADATRRMVTPVTVMEPEWISGARAYYCILHRLQWMG